jgi:uncharacterized protein YbjT (DUF2867 family)
LDLLDKASLEGIPEDIDGAYYLVHSMSSSVDYQSMEELSAINFRNALEITRVRHVVYLGGIVNETALSSHLTSRKNVETILGKGNYNFTALRAGIIIGSGSASFEIIRDLVEKLPLMVAPKWLYTKCQPIGISDVIGFLSKSLFHSKTFNQNFDIGGPDVLSYKNMLLVFARVRHLRRKIFVIPVMTPKLSSYWLYFVTSTSYKLAISLVDSMKVEVVCRDNRLEAILGVKPLRYEEALKSAFRKIEYNEILSQGKFSPSGEELPFNRSEFIKVPTFGCFVGSSLQRIESREECIDRIWRIGGNPEWYYGFGLWKMRGWIDKQIGGIGFRNGRTNPNTINIGDAVDFWRVLYANKKEGRLILYAEMKLPGEAWLEFHVSDNLLTQTSTFRPLGLLGRLYWYAVLPLHGFMYRGMVHKISNQKYHRKSAG